MQRLSLLSSCIRIKWTAIYPESGIAGEIPVVYFYQNFLTIKQKAMMKRIFFLSGIIFLVLTSCKKDDPAPAVPKPLEKAVVSEALLINTPTQVAASGSGNYEYGIKFGVTQNGKVTNLGCRMPTAGTYRVTLWDGSVTPKTVLASANITVTAGGIAFSALGTPVSITTGKDYFLTIWSSGQWFYITPIGGGSFSYPITQGSVQIKGYQWSSSATQTPQVFPTNVDNTYISGIMDFHFQPD